MIKGKYLITAGIAAAVLALTACSGGRGSASGKETQKTAAQKAEAGAEAQASQYVKFKPEEVKEVMDSDDALIVVDVRSMRTAGLAMRLTFRWKTSERRCRRSFRIWMRRLWSTAEAA